MYIGLFVRRRASAARIAVGGDGGERQNKNPQPASALEKLLMKPAPKTAFYRTRLENEMKG